MKTAEAKLKLFDVKELNAKRKICFLLVPNKAEVRLKVHWMSYHVPDDCDRKSLEGFGQVEEDSFYSYG